jgi:N2,N2-dimethylguanosine tRNA methyltransferase
MLIIRYGSYPVKGKYCHEMALRILLASIEVFPLIDLLVFMFSVCMVLPL